VHSAYKRFDKFRDVDDPQNHPRLASVVYSSCTALHCTALHFIHVKIGGSLWSLMENLKQTLPDSHLLPGMILGESCTCRHAFGCFSAVGCQGYDHPRPLSSPVQGISSSPLSQALARPVNNAGRMRCQIQVVLASCNRTPVHNDATTWLRCAPETQWSHVPLICFPFHRVSGHRLGVPWRQRGTFYVWGTATATRRRIMPDP
jgi:hypothetical protein